MADKDYGSLLTRYLDPAETGFDTIVYQGGKALLDSEFVLDQELQNHGRAKLIRQTTPSGWLTGDFDLDSNEDFDFRSEANRFYLINKPIVNVNGWIIPIEYTDTATATENRIDLAAPSSTNELDFVYLEVWRALVGPDPSTDNKPAADKIYRHGNVESLTAEWLDDDLIDPDPEISEETTKRIQIQYRLKTERLVSTGDRTSNRIGYTDGAISAQGPNGALTGLVFSEVAGDPGLWRAGDGDPTNALNTVDGYVYSIPLAIVARRNDQPFNFLSNGNGGSLIASGTSTRPEGLYADEITFGDIQDLRRNVTLGDHNWSHQLERNTSLLMDQNLKSWLMEMALTDWQIGGQSDISGTTLLKADTFENAASDNAGNAFGLPDPRENDGVAFVFSDRSHIERHLEVFTKGGNWIASDILSFTLPAAAPSNAVISDVQAVTLDEGQVDFPMDSVTGLGTTSVDITLGTPPATSSRDIWVVYHVTYASGGGLNAHVEADASNFNVNVHTPSNFDALVGSTFTNDDAGRTSLRSYVFAEYEDGPHREVEIFYTTEKAVGDGTNAIVADQTPLNVISTTDTTIELPEYLYEAAGSSTNGAVQVKDAGGPTTYAIDAATSGRTVVLSAPLPSANFEVEVIYFPKRPVPNSGGNITVYYQTPAYQAINSEYLQNADPENAVDVEPLAVSTHMYVATGGTGSNFTPFPYEAPMNQIAVHNYQATAGAGNAYLGIHELDGPGDISIDDFNAGTGFLKIPAFVPLAPVSNFTLKDPAQAQDVAYEFIDHYQQVDPLEYRPSAIAQSLSNMTSHKCFLPIVARLKEDTRYARAGEMVLVVFSNFLQSEENRFGFTDTNETDGSTCAAIYRLKGNPTVY